MPVRTWHPVIKKTMTLNVSAIGHVMVSSPFQPPQNVFVAILAEQFRRKVALTGGAFTGTAIVHRPTSS